MLFDARPHRLRQPCRVGDQHTGSLLIVFCLGDQVKGNIIHIGFVVGDNGNFAWARLRIDANDSVD